MGESRRKRRNCRTMAHGGYGKRRVAEGNRVGRRSKGPGVDKKPKPKSVTLKNQIRSIERMLRKDLPSEVREAQEKKLQAIKKQQEDITRLAVERKVFLRDRKIKFFERRKIERGLRRLEKLQRTSSYQAQDAQIAEQLSKLKEDLEYVRFFPKTEKYISLFTGSDDSDMVDRRNKLRKQIKANLVAAAASGKDLEETGSEDDGLLEGSEDEFFLSSDDADADDEWTDKSTREQASSASGKAASGMSNDEKNQRQVSARASMPPPRPSTNSLPTSLNTHTRFASSSRTNSSTRRAEMSTSSNTANSRSSSSFVGGGRSSNSKTGPSSNISSSSDARKPRRKRRPKKKKQQA